MEEKVTERMIIRGTPEHCFEVLTAFERRANVRDLRRAISFARHLSPAQLCISSLGKPSRVTRAAFRNSGWRVATTSNLLKRLLE